jgi:hypothetical protein|tara:strand:- start:9031 stop:9342 length:312 start_codon:yes stop_codon:yes gene_type:complete
MLPLHQIHIKISSLRHFAIRCLPFSILLSTSASFAQSSLLESVKRNPAEARILCAQFKSMNNNGQSALSPQAIKQLANQRNLSMNNSEILTTYVIGLHCPDVR